MDKNYKPVYVRGTETGKGVIEALIALGAENEKNFGGTDNDTIYYIDPDNTIHPVPEHSMFGKYIIATARELKPLRWRAPRGGNYYTIDSAMSIIKCNDGEGMYDGRRYKCGNYFRTEAEAEKMLEKIKKILLPD